MEERAAELYESWVNGNLSFVVDEVLGGLADDPYRRSARAALLTTLITQQMTDRERAVFVRMLKDRV